MEDKKKNRLELLKKKNKYKIAKEQLILDCKQRYDIDIESESFLDPQLSHKLHIKAYEKVKTEVIKKVKFMYTIEDTNEQFRLLMNQFINYESNMVVFYISCSQIHNVRMKTEYLNQPVSFLTLFKKSALLSMKILHEIHDDIIIVDQDLSYGVVISEDEYSNVWFEYWDDNY